MHRLTDIQLAAVYSAIKTMEDDGRHTSSRVEMEILELIDKVETIADARELDLKRIDPYEEDNGFEYY